MSSPSDIAAALAAVRIQAIARRAVARKVVAARRSLRDQRDLCVEKLAPLYEQLYELPAAKDEHQHVKLLHHLILKNVCGGGDSLTEASVSALQDHVIEVQHKRDVRANKMTGLEVDATASLEQLEDDDEGTHGSYTRLLKHVQ